MAKEENRIVEAVRRHLLRHPFGDISIAVQEGLVRKDRDWWYVPVQPSERLDRVSPYYELLAEVEEEIDAEEGLNVLLVPTLPN